MEKDNIKVAQETYLSHPLTAVLTAFNRWKETNLGTNIKLFVIVVILSIIITAAFFGAGAASAASSGVFESGATIDKAGEWFMSQGWIYLLGLIAAYILITLPFGIGADYAFVSSQNHRKVGVKESITRGYKRFGIAILTYLLAGLILVVGFAALIVPGIYLAIRFSYLNSLIANENLGPVDTIRRSWALTKGNMWDILGAVSVGVIISSLLNLLVTLVNGSETPISSMISLILSLTSVIASLVTMQVYYFRYHQSALEKAGKLEKTETDKLNYILVVVMLFFFIIDSSTSKSMNSPLLPTNINET